MSKTTMGFIIASLTYLFLGVTLGVLFYLVPATRGLRMVHTHLNLVGTVMFLIMGVAYHILPRFRGRPLHSEGLAWGGFLLANVGLVGLLLVNGIGAYVPMAGFTILAALFGALLALSFYAYIYNMLKTLI